MAAGYSRARAWRRKLVYVALVSALVTAGTLIGASAADARITRIQIMTTESPTFGSYSWPGVGRYEKIVGKAFGEVDPADPLNAVIVDVANDIYEFSYMFATAFKYELPSQDQTINVALHPVFAVPVGGGTVLALFAVTSSKPEMTTLAASACGARAKSLIAPIAAAPARGARRSRSGESMHRTSSPCISPTRISTFRRRLCRLPLDTAVRVLSSRPACSMRTSTDSQSGLKAAAMDNLERMTVKYSSSPFDRCRKSFTRHALALGTQCRRR